MMGPCENGIKKDIPSDLLIGFGRQLTREDISLQRNPFQ